MILGVFCEEFERMLDERLFERENSEGIQECDQLLKKEDKCMISCPIVLSNLVKWRFNYKVLNPFFLGGMCTRNRSMKVFSLVDFPREDGAFVPISENFLKRGD